MKKPLSKLLGGFVICGLSVGRYPDMRVFLRLDIAGKRLAGPGVLAFLLEGLVKADDVDDVEHQAGADEQLHVRYGLHILEL